MATLLPTTDEVYQSIVGELKVHLPGLRVKELPCARDLWGCYADKYLGEWIAVASDVDVFLSERDGSPRPATWSLDMRTRFDGHLHVRGEFRFVFDREKDHQWNSAQDQARILAEQIAAMGEVHEILLVREPDIEAPYGKTLNLLLLAHVESNYRVQIRMDDRGVPWIKGTQIKVREIVLDHLCYGWSAFRIFREHGDSIPLEGIHAAFTYFDNHRVAVLKEIEEADAEADRLCRQLENPLIMAKLRAAKAARK